MTHIVVDELVLDGPMIVFKALLDGTSTRFVALRTVLGRAPMPGEVWNVGGKRENHHKYERQVRVSRAILVRPSGDLLIEAIARSSAFPGIGPVRARALWETFGEGIYTLLDSANPAPFVQILNGSSGRSGEELARVLLEGWRSINADSRTYRWLAEYGFSTALARKLIDLYTGLSVPESGKPEADRKGIVVWHLEDDPYRMLAFAPWDTVDNAARRMGVVPEDPRRLVGAVECVLANRLTQGHTWTSEASLAADVGHVLAKGTHSEVLPAILEAVANGAVVRQAHGYQSRGCWVMEQFVARRCADMAEGRFAPPQVRHTGHSSRTKVASMLQEFRTPEGCSATDEQRRAVWTALSCPISTLVGGPGTGKTTVLRAVHEVAEMRGDRVIQAALAGRAAQRLEEATGRPASTIASLLIRLEHRNMRLDDEPLVVLDEASMVDLPTLYRLMGYFVPGVRLLMLGDPDQLAPIGFGLTFPVLARDPHIPTTRLTIPQRAKAETGIPSVCESIRKGIVPSLSAEWRRGDGVYFVDTPRGEITTTVVELVRRLGGIGTVQVVGSVRKGEGAVDEINRQLHDQMSAGRKPCAGRFHVGEPVIASANNYELGLMNGSLGIVLDSDGQGGLRCSFDGAEKDVPFSYLDDLDLAYAITCHRAQGSQFPRVIVPVTSSRVLDRSLLLTAVSRAQRQTILVGDRTAFRNAIEAPNTTSLREVSLGR